jgi:hypothetical protein
LAIAVSFATKPLLSDNLMVQRIGAAVRTLVLGMAALGTFIFGFVAIGLILLSLQLVFQGKAEEKPLPQELLRIEFCSLRYRILCYK